MDLQLYQEFLFQPIISLIAVLSFFLAFFVFLKLRRIHNGDKIKNTMTKVFGILTIGILFFSAAEIYYSYLLMNGFPSDFTLADILWIVGYLCVAIGFFYFTYHMYEQKDSGSYGLTLWISVAIGLSTTMYLLLTIFQPNDPSSSFLEAFVNYFYPIGSIIVVVSSISTYLFFQDVKNLGLPLLFFSFAYLFDFSGNTLFVYCDATNSYGVPGLVSDLSFVFFYVCVFIGFLLLNKGLATYEAEHKEQKKQSQKE